MASQERESRRGCRVEENSQWETEEWRINGEMEENETWRPRFGARVRLRCNYDGVGTEQPFQRSIFNCDIQLRITGSSSSSTIPH